MSIEALTAAAVALGRALRDSGLCACADQEIVFCQALGEVDVGDRDSVYWAARATFPAGRERLAAFDAVFDRFWAGLALDRDAALLFAGESDPRMPGAQQGGDSTPQFRHEGRSSPLLDGEPSRATREVPGTPGEEDRPQARAERRGLLAAYSPQEELTDAKPLQWQAQELAAVRRLADELRAAAPERVSRRPAPSKRAGHLDLRRTLRQALRTDGELMRVGWSGPSRRPRRLVVICDVSGSMERYSRALLAALGGVVGAGLHAEAFVFATRLTRLTGALASRDIGAALDRARAEVADWSGGTRVGEAIAQFNRGWGRRGMARGAIVIVVSDGWDRGDPEVLACELARLRLQARRLAWINPRPVEVDGHPLAVGMRAALPHVDDYLAGRDAQAIAALGRLVAGLGGARPSRAQRSVSFTLSGS